MRKTLLLSLMMLVIAIPALAQTPPVEIIGGDEPQLRNFLYRFFEGQGYGSSNRIQIYVGQLAEEVAGVPLPADANVTGSIVYSLEYATNEIMFDVPLSPQQVVDHYLSLGYTTPEDNQPPRGGFIAPDQPQYQLMCAPEGGQSLNVTAVDSDTDGNSNVRLYLLRDFMLDACRSNNAEPIAYPRTAWDVLPPVSAPQGATFLRTMGGGGGEFDASTGATFSVSEGSAQTLFESFERQIAGAGWQQSVMTLAESLSIGTWTLTDAESGKDFALTLTVVQNPYQTNEYNALMIVAQRVD